MKGESSSEDGGADSEDFTPSEDNAKDSDEEPAEEPGEDSEEDLKGEDSDEDSEDDLKGESSGSSGIGKQSADWKRRKNASSTFSFRLVARITIPQKSSMRCRR